jgi:hypothetical protein
MQSHGKLFLAERRLTYASNACRTRETDFTVPDRQAPEAAGQFDGRFWSGWRQCGISTTGLESRRLQTLGNRRKIIAGRPTLHVSRPGIGKRS